MLQYSIKADAAFCFYCRLFSVNIIERSFIDVGYKNWKRASGRNFSFQQHARSNNHLNSTTKWQCFKDISSNKDGKISIVAVMNESHAHLVEENRKYLRIIARILLFTVNQGITQRGHDESSDSLNKGNFLELIDLMVENDDFLKSKIDSLPLNAKYLSHDIQDEFFQIMADLVLVKINEELNKSLWCSVIADESKDISKTGQISIKVRYYLDGTIYERFLGFQPAESLNAESLCACIEGKLEKCNVDIIKCVAQTYDGANVMSGHIKVVQSLFRTSYPLALYVHCFNHRWNLILVELCKNEVNGKEFFGILESLYIFMSGCAIHLMFIDLQKLVNPGVKPVELKKISHTRWTSQISACVAFKKLLPVISLFFNKLIEQKHDRMAEAKGFLQQIDFKLVFNLCMFYELLLQFKLASNYMQSITAEIGKALDLVSSFLQTM